GAAAGAMLAFAFAPSSGSASVPLSRALTTPVVVFMLEKSEKPSAVDESPPESDDHRVETPVLDLDAFRAQQRAAASAAVVAGIAATTLANVPRKRPRVVLEHAPYRSIPIRPAEPVAAYPIDTPKHIGWPKVNDGPKPLETPSPHESTAPTPIEPE